VGDKITLRCNFYDDEISWYHEEMANHPITPSISSNRALEFTKLHSKDSGKYFCVGRKEGRVQKRVMSHLFLYVYGKISHTMCHLSFSYL